MILDSLKTVTVSQWLGADNRGEQVLFNTWKVSFKSLVEMMFAKKEVNTAPQQIVIGSLQGNLVLGDTINVHAAQFNAGSGAASATAAFPIVPDDYDRTIGGRSENASATTKAKMISLSENEHIKACQRSSRVIQIHDIQGRPPVS